MSNLQATFQGIEFSTGSGAADKGAVSNEYADTVDGVFKRILALGSAYSRPREGATAEELEKAKTQAPFFCRPMQGNRRKTVAAKPWPIIVLDIDGCPKTAKPQIFEVCGSLSALVYETASSTEATPRLRVVAEANHLILPEECKPVAQAFAEFFYSKIPALADWRSPEGKRAIDTCAEDAAHYFYVPYADAAAKAQIFDGAPVDVDALLQEFGLPPTAKRGKKAAKTSAPADYAPATDADLSPRILPEGFIDPALKALEDKGLIIGDGKQRGMHLITCPFASEHSIDSGDTQTVYYEAGTCGYRYGTFHCMHTCKGRHSQADFFAAVGIDYDKYRADIDAVNGTPESFKAMGGWFTADAFRCYYAKAVGDGYTARAPICARIEVLAQVRDPDGKRWGRLIRYHDGDGLAKERILSDADLAGDPATVRKVLASDGLRILSWAQNAAQLLVGYIYNCPQVKKARIVSSAGWYAPHGLNGRRVYVLPDETLGQTDEAGAEEVRYYSETNTRADFSQKGTADEWRENIGCYVSQSRPLMLAVGAALGAPLAKLISADEMGGGFHFFGGSGRGKTMAVKVAAGIYGAPASSADVRNGRITSWQDTPAALMDRAIANNDGLLCLDEIGTAGGASRSSRSTLAQTIYNLSGGEEKGRLRVDASARERRHWFINILSSGEMTVRKMVEREGGKADVGLETRLIDVQADADGGENGIFDHLTTHGLTGENARARADNDEAAENHGRSPEAEEAFSAVGGAVGRCYGAIGREWLEYLTAKQDEIPAVADALRKRFANAVGVDVTRLNGQLNRGYRRFELAAVAYALACEAGILSGDAAEGLKAVGYLYTQWAAERGDTNAEERRIIMSIRAICEQPANFPRRVDFSLTVSVRGVYGFKVPREETGAEVPDENAEAEGFDPLGYLFHVLPSMFPKMIGDYSEKDAKRILKSRGILRTDKNGDNVKVRLEGTSKRFVVLDGEALASVEG